MKVSRMITNVPIWELNLAYQMKGYEVDINKEEQIIFDVGN